jgi:hypothetical protein
MAAAVVSINRAVSAILNTVWIVAFADKFDGLIETVTG